jgi:hypothetical protein
MKLLHQVLRKNEPWPANVPPLEAREIYMALREHYVPQVAPIRHTLLVKASSGTGDDAAAREAFTDPLLGWGGYVRGDIRVFDAPAGHSSMLYEGEVAFIATLLAPFLQS